MGDVPHNVLLVVACVKHHHPPFFLFAYRTRQTGVFSFFRTPKNTRQHAHTGGFGSGEYLDMEEGSMEFMICVEKHEYCLWKGEKKYRLSPGGFVIHNMKYGE